jgi:alginate O-acetyltransferase complex protein AlgI
MLFNSTFFLFVFLPIVVAAFLAIARGGRTQLALGWLLAASLFFYGWAQPAFVLLLLASIGVNFGIGLRLQDAASDRARRAWLVAGVSIDLLALAVFKYAHFALDSFGLLTGQQWGLPAIALPLAISFFTFQQIAYLSDTAAGRVRERRLLPYALFVAFFPKLVAGPIVHHDEMLDQLDGVGDGSRDRLQDLNVGLTLFVMGLFKKAVLADAIAGRTGAFFDAASLGLEVTFLEAWTAAIGFTLQVYFDFSGYSDMALGLARCFGIVLPLNFHSPYKATDISEFWRRWHITLTRWLRLFLFVPISRKIMRRAGSERWDTAAVVVAQLVTMGLCGLWHGAGWNFVLWGALHGGLLVGHDGWVAVKRRLHLVGRIPAPLARGLGRATLLVILAATFVIFRADSLPVAGGMLEAMLGARGVIAPGDLERFASAVGVDGALALLALLAIVWFAPNTQQILGDYEPALDLRRFAGGAIHERLRWRPSPAWALVMLVGFLSAVYAVLVEGYEEFIYRFF